MAHNFHAKSLAIRIFAVSMLVWATPFAVLADDDILAAPAVGGATSDQNPASEADKTPEDWTFHGQYTSTYQIKPNFHSPYQSVNSFNGKYQARDSNTATAFLGARLWQGGEVYLNPEMSEGFGISQTYGLAGFSNGEAQKGGSQNIKAYPARYFLKQVIGLGGEQEWIEGGPNQLAGAQDVSRLTLIGGGVAATDYFQNNLYANDPRTNFTNWAIWESAAWDVPGNSRGYTRGVYGELNEKQWALRYGAFAMPSILNGTDVYFHSDQTLSHNLELEERHTLADRPGKVRLMGFYNRGPMGNYRDALELAAQGGDINDSMQKTRTIGHDKFGFAANLEQEIADELGAFARLSWNNGRSESWGFTDVDSSVAAGLSLKGGRLGRKDDTIGVGTALNGITQAHRQFLAAGGQTLLLGDGALNYGNELDFETFYALRVADPVTLTLDYQFINNPGYNQDRGPVSVYGMRLHAEF